MKITHRQHGSTGRLFGVEFVDGVGHTDDPAALEKLRRQGHRVEPDQQNEIANLVDYAIENGIPPIAVDDTQELQPYED